MFKEFIKSFSLIFLAEIGDKSLIIAMYFAIQYLIKDVFIGITIGVIANHGLAIYLGRLISKSFPLKEMQFIVGLMFIIFGYLTLKENGFDEFKKNNRINPIITVALTYFIGELGDKTQITAMTLAIDSNYFIVILMGTTMGMIATSGLGILIGSKMGSKIPETSIKLVSSMIFLIIGTIKTIKYISNLYLSLNNIILLIIMVSTIEILLIYRYLKRYNKKPKKFSIKKAANDIYKQTDALNQILDEICLGKENCRKCSGKKCLLGYAKHILEEARTNQNLYNKEYININKLIKKNYNKEDVMRALIIILLDYESNGWIEDKNYIINKIKTVLENILFNENEIKGNSTKAYLKNIRKIDKNVGLNINKMIISIKGKVII